MIGPSDGGNRQYEAEIERLTHQRDQARGEAECVFKAMQIAIRDAVEERARLRAEIRRLELELDDERRADLLARHAEETLIGAADAAERKRP